MKSQEIKNWRYELSYKKMIELEDFDELLLEAISKDSCLMCGGDKVNNAGLCMGCSMHLTKQDKIAMEKIENEYEVLITVRKREKNKEQNE